MEKTKLNKGLKSPPVQIYRYKLFIKASWPENCHGMGESNREMVEMVACNKQV